jgi:hypothetical protein
MTRHEQEIEMMARLFECRTAARFLLRERYDETLAPYRDLIGAVMAREKVLPLHAVLWLAEPLPVSDAVPLMLLMAAAVDLIEAAPTVNAGASPLAGGATESAPDPSSSSTVP